jgi:hypothetical protein
VLKRIVVFSFAFAAWAAAQNMTGVQANNRPDHKLSYTITLEAPVKGSVSNINASFNLISDERPDQKGLRTDFTLSAIKQISAVQFEVYGDRPLLMTGTYRLNQIQFQTNEGAVRNYRFPDDYKDVTVTIQTDQKDIFPKIKSVETTP